MKKLFSVLAVAWTVVALLGGCGGEEDALKKKVKELEEEVEELKKGKDDSQGNAYPVIFDNELKQVKKGKDDPQGNDVAPSKKKAFRIPNLNLEMLWCVPGTFTMGSHFSEWHRKNDETQHTVTLTEGFWLGKYEVTQAQWQSIMGWNPSYFKGANLPVDTVSWNDVTSFCTKLTERERRAGRLPKGYAYQLPTEAQWEYACRAGTRTTFSFGDTLSSRQANFNGNYPYGGAPKGVYLAKTVEVGSYPANAWGFHDMHGNIDEWCQDFYDSYPRGSVSDPVGPAYASNRVMRGGDWSNSAMYCVRSAARRGVPQGNRSEIYSNGFRLSLRLVESE